MGELSNGIQCLADLAQLSGPVVGCAVTCFYSTVRVLLSPSVNVDSACPSHPGREGITVPPRKMLPWSCMECGGGDLVPELWPQQGVACHACVSGILRLAQG